MCYNEGNPLHCVPLCCCCFFKWKVDKYKMCLFLLQSGDVDYWWAKGWSEAASAWPDPDITGEMQSSKSAAVWRQQDAAEIQQSQHKRSQVWPHYNVLPYQPYMCACAAEPSAGRRFHFWLCIYIWNPVLVDKKLFICFFVSSECRELRHFPNSY